MLRTLAFALTTLAAPALAQGQFDGTWSFLSDGESDPFFVIELEESAGTMQGAGLVMNGQGAIVEGTLAVTAGASFDTALQVELEVQPQGDTVVLTVIDSRATLIVAGDAIQGRLIRFGALTSTDTESTTTETASAQETCESMMTVQQDAILHAPGTERTQIEAIYDQADSRYGQDLTLERCSYLLNELSAITGARSAVADAPGTTAPTRPVTGTSCDDVDPLVASIYAELSANSLPDDGTVQRLLDEASLGTDGIWSTGACEYGISNLRDYLATIGAAPAGQTPTQTTTGVVKDPTQPAPGTVLTGMRQMEFQIDGVSQHLNMRSGPGTRYGVVYQLPYFARNMRIIGAGCSPSLDEARFATLTYASQVVELSSRWCEVEWNNTQGWVAASYLRPM